MLPHPPIHFLMTRICIFVTALYAAGLLAGCGSGSDLNLGATPTPFNLYVAVAADGALTDVTTLPSTPVGACFGDELRTARLPAPPFAPFHAQVEMRFGG